MRPSPASESGPLCVAASRSTPNGASGAAWRWVVSLFAAGALDPGPLISHRFGLGEYELAFAALRDRDARALKVQLVP